MMKHFSLIFLSLVLFSCNSGDIKLRWVDNLQEDFSFTEQWSYPENVFQNELGQLICDGICDTLLDQMRDENGKIIEDSIDRYYQLLDTTHYYHTISCQANCYEWAGSNFVYAHRNKDTVICYTENTISTHSSLEIRIIGNTCIPRIELNSIASPGLQHFSSKSGHINIDKTLWKEGIFKAEFDFTFDDPEHPEKPIWWKGKIYTKIN